MSNVRVEFGLLWGEIRVRLEWNSGLNFGNLRVKFEHSSDSIVFLTFYFYIFSTLKFLFQKYEFGGMMVAVSLVLLLTVLEQYAAGIKTDHGPEIIEHPKDEYIGKRNLFLSWKYQTTSILQLNPLRIKNFSRFKFSKIFENFFLNK